MNSAINVRNYCDTKAVSAFIYLEVSPDWSPFLILRELKDWFGNFHTLVKK